MQRYSRIDEGFYAAGQIGPEDMAEIASLGVGTIVNNRPDGEGGPEQPGSEALRAAAEAAGLQYHYIPMTFQTLDSELLERFHSAVAGSSSPVLAHCRSGARSVSLWALDQACHGSAGVEEVLAKARAAGYDLSGLRPTIDRFIALHEDRRPA